MYFLLLVILILGLKRFTHYAETKQLSADVTSFRCLQQGAHLKQLTGIST
jgi:hypothetical protein